jgi:murein DD-endopeptidase MepM/ murein hydrolase activator NlpD
LKRALKKRVKAELENTPSDEVPLEDYNALNIKVNSRMPQKAAMIGLAISMGATSILVTRQSDQALAVEPIGEQSTASVVPAASDTQVKIPTTPSLEPQAVSSVSTPENPVRVEAKATSQVSELGAKLPAVTAKRVSVPAGNTVVVPNEPQVVKELNIPRAKAKLQKNKLKETSLSSPESVSGSQSLSLSAEPQTVISASTPEREVNAQLKAQQEFALSRLQEKSHRLRQSIARWRGSEAKEISAAETSPVQPMTVVETTPQASVSPMTRMEQSETVTDTNKTSLISRLKQKRSVAKMQMQVPTPAPMVPAVVTPSTNVTYEVKPGDTLAAIANNYGTSVSQLAKANNLINPNQLKINQELIVPTVEKPIITTETNGVINQGVVVPSNTDQVAQVTEESIISDESVSLILPTEVVANEIDQASESLQENNGVTASKEPSPEVVANEIHKADELSNNNNSVTAVTPQTPAEAANSLIENNTQSTSANSIASSGVTLEGVPTMTTYNGMGGDTPVPKVVSQLQQAKKEANTKVKQTKDERLRSLKEEIEKLREKYRAQQSGNNVVVPEVTQTNRNQVETRVPTFNNTPRPTQVSNRNNTSIPIRVPVLLQNRNPVPIPVPQPSRIPNNAGNQNAEEPINPEFVPNSAGQESPVNQRSVRIPTPPVGVDANQSLGALRGTTVYPQLPPLAAVDRYLPRPVEETLSAGYIWPAKGVVTSGYGMRWGRMHRGIDIANATGTPIYAAADGVVESAGWNRGGYGKLVDLRHPDGSITRYAHNSKLLVKAGQVVQQGQTIALMGSTGFSTGPHSHFEIHPSGKGAVNPIALLPRV